MKLDYPATQRNKDALLEVLREHLPERGVVLEIASGSGQHAIHFARHLVDITWQPSSRELEERASIDAYRAAAPGLENLRHALALDVHDDPWPIASAEAIVCINMIHIAPWQATLDLFAGAARLLGPGGVLITYGPYRFEGVTAPSNERFCQSLRARDPRWGVRDLVDLEQVARAQGISRSATESMPANNHSLVWTRDG